MAWDGVASVARHRELVVNKAFELGDDHVVIIFLEVSGIKPASLDGKSPVGVSMSFEPDFLLLSLYTSHKNLLF